MKFLWPYHITSFYFHKVLCVCIKLELPRLFREFHGDHLELHLNVSLFMLLEGTIIHAHEFYYNMSADIF